MIVACGLSFPPMKLCVWPTCSASPSAYPPCTRLVSSGSKRAHRQHHLLGESCVEGRAVTGEKNVRVKGRSASSMGEPGRGRGKSHDEVEGRAVLRGEPEPCRGESRIEGCRGESRIKGRAVSRTERRVRRGRQGRGGCHRERGLKDGGTWSSAC